MRLRKLAHVAAHAQRQVSGRVSLEVDANFTGFAANCALRSVPLKHKAEPRTRAPLTHARSQT